METQTAYCGIECSTCPIYLASLEQDQSKQQLLRESIARQCADIYGLKVNPEDVTDCDGCKADTGRMFSGCVNCQIRKCAQQKKLESCAFCTDYVCETLEEFFAHDPAAQDRLEKIRVENSIRN